jgi:prepilin-type processing-associated H-X9-DG protein
MTSDTPPENEKPFQFSIRAMLILMAVIGVVGGSFVSAVRKARDAACTSECHGQLYFLAYALRNYHDTYETFPPAAVMGPDGRPWHSWRTLLLPFIEQRELYADYSFDEPWNGPSNRALSPTALRAFHCDADTGPTTNTSYVAITGPGTMWPDGQTLSLSEIPNGGKDTIMLVEINGSGIHWMEPRDLRIDKMTLEINGAPGNSISSKHLNGAVVAYADGHIELLGPETTAASIRRGLLMVDEHESVPGPE